MQHDYVIRFSGYSYPHEEERFTLPDARKEASKLAKEELTACKRRFKCGSVHASGNVWEITLGTDKRSSLYSRLYIATVSRHEINPS